MQRSRVTAPREKKEFNISSVPHRLPARLSGAVEDAADIGYRGEVREEGDEIGELGVVRVVEPRGYGDSVVRVEDVRRGRVVEDDRVPDGAAELGEVLWAGGVRSRHMTRRGYICTLT